MAQKKISKKTLFFTFFATLLFTICAAPTYASDVVKEEQQDDSSVVRRKPLVRSTSLGEIPQFQGPKLTTVKANVRDNEKENNRSHSMRQRFSYGVNLCAVVSAVAHFLQMDSAMGIGGKVFWGTLGLSCAVGVLGINLVLNHL